MSKSFSEPLKAIRGKTLTGSLKIPSLRQLWNILKNGGEIEFEIEDDGWNIEDMIAASQLQEKEQNEMEKSKKSMNNKMNNIRQRM